MMNEVDFKNNTKLYNTGIFFLNLYLILRLKAFNDIIRKFEILL